jgi:hypothetical protein
MWKMRTTLGLAITALYLAGCTALQSIPSMPADIASTPATTQDIADASNSTLWGILTELPGQSRTSSRNGGTTIVWRWVKPGWLIEEEWYAKGQTTPMSSAVYWRGPEPGIIYSQTPGMMSLAWEGRVQPDGSIAFAGAGPLSMSYHLAKASDGLLEIRGATIKEGQLVSLDAVQPTDRYTLASSSSSPKTTASTSAAITTTNPPITSKTETKSETPQRPSSHVDNEVAQAEQRLQSASQAVRQAETAALQAEIALQNLNAMDASFKPVPPSGDKRGDFWSYCWYGVISNEGKATHVFVTNLINQRIWTEPFPLGNKQAIAEFDAYNGPNTPDRVGKRFEAAMKASGLLPNHHAYASDCGSYISQKMARSRYDEWQRNNDPKPTYVIWSRLENKDIEGSIKLPTAEEAARIKREAGETKKKLFDALEAEKQEQKLLALRKETAQRAQDCAAGKTSACGARGTKN